ncbi:MAG: hypothetical protein HC871_16130, partial [Rhizobiales bacterium]|nr:hypothetical protein [Hyphomicrobiales bacterium]
TERMLGEAHGTGAITMRVAVDLYTYAMTEAAEPIKSFVDRHGLPDPLITPDETLPPSAYRLGRP